MSNRPTPDPSPSNIPEPTIPRAASTPEASHQQPTSESYQFSAETPQATAGPRSLSTPPDLSARQHTTSHPPSLAPLIVISESPQLERSAEPESSRQGRPLVARHSGRSSSSQPPRRSTTPYTRSVAGTRARSQPRSTPRSTSATMSSASSSPASTSTAGATSGSNPSYQLPYAPFPYPMPANARGGQGQQGSSNNSGK